MTLCSNLWRRIKLLAPSLEKLYFLIPILTLPGCYLFEPFKIPDLKPINDGYRVTVSSTTDIGRQTLYQDEVLERFLYEGEDSYCRKTVGAIFTYMCFKYDAQELTHGLNPKTGKWDQLDPPVPFNRELIVTQTFQPREEVKVWRQFLSGTSFTYDLNGPNRYYYSLNNGMSIKKSEWEDFLRDYVESIPVENRETVLDAVSRYSHYFDEVEMYIRYRPLQHGSGPYYNKSYISLIGTLQKNKATAIPVIRYFGESWLFVDRFKVVADDFKWDSPHIKFERDMSGTKVTEWVYLNIELPEIREILEKIITAKKSIVRLYGHQYYRDIEVTDRMKQDISAMLEGVKTINKQSDS